MNWSEKTDYGYALGRVRALELTLLGRSQYERLIRARAVSEFVTYVADAGYACRMEDNFAQALATAEAENFAFFQRYCQDRWVLDLFRIQADVHNLKVVMKHHFAGTEPKPDELLGHGKWPVAQLAALVTDEKNGKDKAVRIKLSPDDLGLYQLAVTEARTRYDHTKDPGVIDMRLDRLAQELACRLTNRRSPFLYGYFSLHADLVNLRTLVRIKELGEDRKLFEYAFLPGGTLTRAWLNTIFPQDWDTLLHQFSFSRFREVIEDGVRFLRGAPRSFARLERLAREMELTWLRRSRYTPFGYEPLVTFYLLRDNEHTNLRQLYAAKLVGWPESICRDLVAYVD